MKAERILMTGSLAETLWRLEEVRKGFRKSPDVHVKEALDWVLSRQGLKGAYGNLFSATEKDLKGVQLPTGERIYSAALRHILGEEALRTVIAWNLKASPVVEKAVNSFNQLLVRGGDHCAKESGFYCCHKCTPAFLRTLAVVKPDDWDKTLEKGIKNIKSKRLPNGRWHGFPFYYTLLTLSEIETPLARAELKHAGKTAEKLLKQYQNNDRTSRFRRLGLEAALNALN